MDRLLLRPAEAAEALGVSRSRVYELIQQGELPSLRIGGVVRVPVEGLRDWIEAQLGTDPAPAATAPPTAKPPRPTARGHKSSPQSAAAV
jgi:excisionase family DNA binding protein